MKITPHQIPIRRIVDGYKDQGHEGVVGYGGKLDIRPPYQREFVYGDKDRNAVINTVKNEFPLNVLYWVDRQDGTYEVLDGQQRILSICQYFANDYSIRQNGDPKYFHNLDEEQKNQILDYELMVYFCKGTDKEKLDWFEIVNVAGVELTKQELRNAVYHGSFVSDAKIWFSKQQCPAHNIGSAYVQEPAIRQGILEAALKWINDGKIEAYMAEHQHDKNADKLWQHFQAVIDWVKKTFPKYRKEMKSVDWGVLHKDYKNKKLDAKKLEEEVKWLMEDEDVQRKAGIYPYVLTREQKHLNIRAFSDKHKREAYERQNQTCTSCEKIFGMNEMEADHITPWIEGGKTIPENCQMLCKRCNREKGAR